jgi:hypothetical protein
MTKICVVCHKEKQGRPVRDDIVLKSIRRVKEVLKISTGNDLVVCPDDYEEAKKRRQDFEKSLLTAGGIGAVLGIILVVIAVISGRDIIGILSSILFLIALVIIFALLSFYKYFPAVEEKPTAERAKEKPKAKPVRRTRRR